jgi:hypothetical protein
MDFPATPPTPDVLDENVRTLVKRPDGTRAGIERSPLTVAWYMCRRRVVADLDQAYAWLIKKRPVVQDRRMWLESLP